MAIRHRTFSFTAHDARGVVDEMLEFGAGADGRRWMNIVPDADEREIHTGTAMWRVFSSRGPVIPKLTWVPAHLAGSQHQPAQVGLAHATGRGAVERITGHDLVVPAGWHLAQDHQKRGVIFDLDDQASPEDIVAFGTQALRMLSPFAFEDYFLVTFSQR